MVNNFDIVLLAVCITLCYMYLSIGERIRTCANLPVRYCYKSFDQSLFVNYLGPVYFNCMSCQYKKNTQFQNQC